MFQLSIRSIVGLYITSALLLLLFPTIASAAAIGASPSRISNDLLMPGVSYSGSISISRDVADTDNKYYVVASGNAIDWIDIHGLEGSEAQNEWMISAGETSRDLEYTITVPEDAQPQTKNGFIIVQQLESTSTNISDANGSAAAILPAVSITLDLTVTEEVVEDYIVQHIVTAPVDADGDIFVVYTVDNIGNTPIHPRSIQAAVVSTGDNKQLLQDTVQLYDKELVAPFSSGVFAIAIPHELEVGNYWLDVAVRAPSGSGVEQFEDRLSIEVVSELPQVDRGTITELSFEETEQGYTKFVDISSIFTNTSGDFVPVAVRTTVQEKNGVIDTETDVQVFVAAPNDSVELTNELSFSDVGQYTILVEAKYPGGEVQNGEYTVLVKDDTVVSQILNDQTNRRIAVTLLIIAIFIIIGGITQMTRGYVKKVDTPKKDKKPSKVVRKKESVTEGKTEKKKEGKSIDKKTGKKEQDKK